jgi:hypothetical protein
VVAVGGLMVLAGSAGAQTTTSTFSYTGSEQV